MAEIKKAPAVSIITYAYNVEDYIRECAESVLKQTFTDFEWVILVNGCTDKTSEILKEYAKKDQRIKLFHNQKNSFFHPEALNPDFSYYSENLLSEYWCSLDSDDFLEPDFLQELYKAAKEYDADIVLGGTEMFMEENPQMRGVRSPPDFFSGDITVVADRLPEVYGCFRTMWGKLFKVSIVKKQQEYRNQFPLNVPNAGDTLFSLDCLRFSNSVVGVNKVLHYYRIRKNSYYYSHVDETRYIDYKIIFEESKKLLQHWNKLNDTTLRFITLVLYGTLQDYINIAADSVRPIPPQERIAVIEGICNDSSIYQIFNNEGLTTNLFMDTQKAIERIMNKIPESEFPCVLQYYMYRLFKSLKMVNDPLANQQAKQNALLLYLSSLCDETNRNQFGAVLLYPFLRAAGKNRLAELEQAGIKSEFLTSNPVLLRELIHSKFDHVIEICEEHTGEASYDLLKKELKQRVNQYVDSAKNDNDYLRRHIPEAIELFTNVLVRNPLEKEALIYKLYFQTIQGDDKNTLETAETLRVFYPNDRSAMKIVAQIYANMGQKERAKQILEKAFNMNLGEVERIEISSILDNL